MLSPLQKILSPLGKSKGGLSYLWQAGFGTAQGAPMPSSYAVDIGVLEKVLDGSNLVSVASGKLDFAGTSAVNFTNPAYIGKASGGAGFARNNGTAFKFTFEVKTNTARPVFIGLSNNTSPTSLTNMGIYLVAGAGASVATPGGASPNLFTWTIGTYTFVVLEFSDGFALLGKGGALGSSWVLLWTDHTTSSATLYPSFQGVSQVDYEVDSAVLVAGLGAPFNTDYGLASLQDTTLATGDTFTGTADGLHDFVFALPGSPSAGDEISLNIRRQDASNKIRAIVKRNAGNTAWDLQVRDVVAGTPATPAGWADVTGIGTPVELRVISFGTSIAFYTRSGTTWTKRGNTITDTNFQSATGMEIEAASGTTLTSVVNSPRTSSDFTTLDNL